MEPDRVLRRRSRVSGARANPPRAHGAGFGALAALVLTSCVLAWSGAAAAQDGTAQEGAEGIAIEVVAGYDGRYLVGRRLPVTVDITADRLVRGSVEVQIDGLAGSWSIPVEVPGGSEKQVVVVIPSPSAFAVSDVQVRLIAGDEVVTEQPTLEPLESEELVGLLPGVTPADLPEPVTFPHDVGTARFVRLDVDSLAVPGMLDPVGTVVAGADELGRLDAAGRAELLDWTERGGHLVVDSPAGATVAGLPDEWQPGDRTRAAAGLGQVRTSGGRAAAGDWAAVVAPTPTVSNQELAAFGWWGTTSSLSDSLARDAGLDALDLPWLAGFVVAYIVLCGPVAYFALRRRRSLGWLVVPAVAVTFTVAAFVIGSDLRAGTTTSHGTVVELSATGVQATTVLGAVSRSGTDGEATFPAGWTVSPLDSSSTGIDTGAPIAVTTTPGGSRATIPLAAGDFGVARGSGRLGDDAADLGISIEAASVDGEVAGTITNEGDLHLERVGIFLGRQGVHVGSIDPGQTVDFVLRGNEFSNDPFAPPEATVWPSESGYNVDFDPGGSATSVVNLSLLADYLEPLGPNARPRGVVTMVAWTRDLDSPADISGPGDPEGRSIVVARAPVTATDDPLAQGSVHRELLRGPRGVELPDDQELPGRMDGYLWRFSLPEGAPPGPLRVAIPGYLARVDAWDGEAWVVLDRRSGEFFGDIGAQRAVDLPASVVLDGQVLLRGFGMPDFGPTLAQGIDVFGVPA